MILHDDDKNQECFRKYDDPEKSYNDHSKFLTQRKRYAFLFRLPITDYEAWARGLKKAGYATDPSYPDKLIYIINKYNLDKMDKEVLQQMSVKVDNTTNTNENKKKKFIYEVKDGETLFTISKKFNVPVKDIQRINNLNDFDIYQGQILVLTESNDQEDVQVNNAEPENKDQNEQNDIKIKEKEITSIQSNKPTKTKIKAEELDLHVVKQGETLFSISKSYHVSIEALKKLNNINSNSIAVGSVIKVPKTKQQTKVKPKKTNKSSTKTSNAVYHIVKPGETLYRIHVNYKVSIKKLRQLNHLKGNNIKVGQKIRVK
jgi:LysM repeat protein